MGDDFDDEANEDILQALAILSEVAESMMRAQATLREATQLLNEEELARRQEELARLPENMQSLNGEDLINRLRELERARERLAELQARRGQQNRTNDIGANGEPVIVSPRIAGTRPVPECTDSARLNRIDETLILDAVVRRNGSVEVQGIVNDGNIPQDMVEAAASTVRQWDFEPGTLNGRPVDVSLNIEVNIDCG